MVKQTKPRKPDNLIKGNVSPVQVAFIVDRYLSDNNYSQTRSSFRVEASSLISKSPIQEAPKSLLSLGAMLNEYISLKEQKVILDQERVQLEQEKVRVQNLLQGMQGVMSAYNASGRSPPPPPSILAAPANVAVFPHSESSAGHPMNNTQPIHPQVTHSNTNMNNVPQNFSTPVTNDLEANKRKASKTSTATSAPPASKRSRNKLAPRKLANKEPDTHPQSAEAISNVQTAVQHSNEIQSSSSRCLLNESVVQGSSVVKCLFNQPSLSIPINASGPKTPPRANSSQSEKSTSPHEEISSAVSNNNTPQDVSSACCTVISSSKRVTISPYKQVAYYTVERNHNILSPSPVKSNAQRQGKRDHVKGRLDFDVSDIPTSSDNGNVNEIYVTGSEKQSDIFDLDFLLGEDFSFTEILDDLDKNCGVFGCSSVPTLGASTDTFSGSSHESMDGNMGTDQIMSEFSSTVTQILSGKDTNPEGTDSLTAVKSMTKCIRILSPAKKL